MSQKRQPSVQTGIQSFFSKKKKTITVITFKPNKVTWLLLLDASPAAAIPHRQWTQFPW